MKQRNFHILHINYQSFQPLLISVNRFVLLFLIGKFEEWTCGVLLIKSELFLGKDSSIILPKRLVDTGLIIPDGTGFGI